MCVLRELLRFPNQQQLVTPVNMQNILKVAKRETIVLPKHALQMGKMKMSTEDRQTSQAMADDILNTNNAVPRTPVRAVLILFLVSVAQN